MNERHCVSRSAERDCNFEYLGYSLTAYYIEEDRVPFVSEIWYGDNVITELVNDKVYEAAMEAAQQDIFDYDAYLYERNEEMRYENS